jgi:two-component system OmpR family sensor kinase
LLGAGAAWLVGRAWGGEAWWPAALTTLGAAWLGSALLARHLARPLVELAELAEAYGAGQFARRAPERPWRRGDEAAALAASMHAMAARLEAQREAERELLASVSHELRTPLGHLRVLVELAEARGLDSALVRDLELELSEIDALVGELLARSRLEQLERRAGELPPVELGELTRRALERAPLDGAMLEPLPPEPSWVRGDATLLLRALANLLDNAARHGGGVRAVRVRRDGPDVVVEVDDHGPGGGGAPALEDRRPHLGLGLALVERIARVHGGRSTLTRDVAGWGGGAGARASLAIPADADSPARA